MADGFDTSIYNGAMPKDPMEGLSKTVGVANQIQENRLLGQREQSNAISIDNSKLDLAAKQFGQARGIIASLLTNPKAGKEDMTKEAGEAVAQGYRLGLYNASQAAEALQGFPQNPNMQRQWLQGHADNLLSATEKLQQYQGTPQVVNTGNQLEMVQVPGRPGLAGASRGTMPLQLPPDTQTIGPDNKTRLQGPSGPPGFQPAPSDYPVPQVPAVPAQPKAPRGAKPAAPQQPQDLVTKLAPDQAASLEKTGAGAGMELSDARHRSLNYQQEVFPLEQAIPALEKLGTKGTGPGTEAINRLKSFIASNIPGADFKGMTDDVAAFDKAKKYLTDFVNQNGNSGTNDKLAAAFAGNPSVNISNAAAVDVAKSALSLRRMKQAQLVAFEHSGLPESDFAKFASKWAIGVDPRAYGFDLMTPAQRKSTLENLPKGKRELFMMNVQDAAQQGMIRAPQ